MKLGDALGELRAVQDLAVKELDRVVRREQLQARGEVLSRIRPGRVVDARLDLPARHLRRAGRATGEKEQEEENRDPWDGLKERDDRSRSPSVEGHHEWNMLLHGRRGVNRPATPSGPACAFRSRRN
jgi:hypothetical protein